MQIITKKDIITNLNKQYGIKKGRRAKIMMACGVIVALLCLCTGYFLGAILAIVFFLCGLSDRIRSDHNRKKIEEGDFVVKKGICISKNIHGNASGIRRNKMKDNYNNIIIRNAQISDAEELLEIYRPYVENTAISFEYEVPSVEEFKNRIQKIIRTYPYLVAIENDHIVGYAYASPFHVRKAYQWSVETSIYIKEGEHRKGYGKMLYYALENVLKKQNILNLNACIAYTEKEDQYLTNGSKRFHEQMGFRLAGRFHESGYKFGTWYDMIWMEKIIGEHLNSPMSVLKFSEIQ